MTLIENRISSKVDFTNRFSKNIDFLSFSRKVNRFRTQIIDRKDFHIFIFVSEKTIIQDHEHKYELINKRLQCGRKIGPIFPSNVSRQPIYGRDFEMGFPKEKKTFQVDQRKHAPVKRYYKQNSDDSSFK